MPGNTVTATQTTETISTQVSLQNDNPVQPAGVVTPSPESTVTLIAGIGTNNAIVAQAGDTVSVFYTGTLDNGTIFDTNIHKTPLVFTLGSGQMIPGFDAAVNGMTVGEIKTVHIPVDQAYGPYHPDLVETFDRASLSLPANIAIGEILTATNPKTGATTSMKVIGLTPSTITVDANFVLAGQNLTFTITVADIKKRNV